MSPRTAARFKIQFAKHIVPRIGACRIAELTAETVLKDLLRPIEETGHRETALRVRAALSRVLRFAFAEGQLQADVTSALAGALTPPAAKHMPAITDKPRVGRLTLAIRNHSGGPIVAAALRTLPCVFVRPRELREAEWPELDLADALRRMPPERMKARGAHVAPLPKQVIDLLSRLRPVTGEGRYLFPGRNLSTKPISNEHQALGHLVDVDVEDRWKGLVVVKNLGKRLNRHAVFREADLGEGRKRVQIVLKLRDPVLQF